MGLNVTGLSLGGDVSPNFEGADVVGAFVGTPVGA